jgi:hypothetical protein
MSEEPQDLRSRTKAFALRIIRMYSKLPKNDTVAQVLTPDCHIMGFQPLHCGPLALPACTSR